MPRGCVLSMELSTCILTDISVYVMFLCIVGLVEDFYFRMHRTSTNANDTLVAILLLRVDVCKKQWLSKKLVRVHSGV